MRGLFIRWLISALSLLATGYLVPGFEVRSFWYALFAAVVLGILNAVVRPVLIVLTLPLTVVTLGLFIFVVNALMLWLLSALMEGIQIAGFWPALAGAFILSVIGWLTSSFIGGKGQVEYIDLQKGPDGRWS
ncbi:MAG: phage holin family protein [Thermodesulfobacteriota bacterium]